MSTKKISLIVFDFDGTIVETEHQVVKIINKLRVRFGFRPLTLESFRNRSQTRLVWVYRLVGLISPLAIRFIQKKQTKNIKSMKIEPGLLRVIKRLKNQGYDLGIISSNSVENIDIYLRAHGMVSLFQFVKVVSGLDNKAKVIKTMIDEIKYTPDRVVYVGDEVGDVRAAQSAGVRVVGVTWGFQARQVFAVCNPDWLIDRPKQLLDIFIIRSWWRRLFGFLN